MYYVPLVRIKNIGSLLFILIWTWFYIFFLLIGCISLNRTEALLIFLRMLQLNLLIFSFKWWEEISSLSFSMIEETERGVSTSCVQHNQDLSFDEMNPRTSLSINICILFGLTQFLEEWYAYRLSKMFEFHLVTVQNLLFGSLQLSREITNPSESCGFFVSFYQYYGIKTELFFGLLNLTIKQII